MKASFWILMVISAFLLIFAQIAMKQSLRVISHDDLKNNLGGSIGLVLRQRAFWLSIVLNGFVFIIMLYNLTSTPLSKMIPIYIGIYYFGLLALSTTILKESLSSQKILGYILMFLAVLLISRAK